TNSVPYAAEFVQLFPDASVFLSGYIGGSPDLAAEVILYDRYILTMQISVVMDSSRRKVKRFGQPEFLLLEVSEVTKERREGRQPDGSPVFVEIPYAKSGDT